MILKGLRICILSTTILAAGCDAPAPDADYDQALVTARVERLVKARLKDPESATFQHFDGGCGLVNSRNSFGGMSGDKQFIVGSNDRVVFREDGPADFATLWNGHCAKMDQKPS